MDSLLYTNTFLLREKVLMKNIINFLFRTDINTFEFRPYFIYKINDYAVSHTSRKIENIHKVLFKISLYFTPYALIIHTYND